MKKTEESKVAQTTAGTAPTSIGEEEKQKEKEKETGYGKIQIKYGYGIKFSQKLQNTA